jgi:hypothetical protein
LPGNEKKKTVSRSGGLGAESFARSPLGLIVKAIAILAFAAQRMLGDERLEDSRAHVGAQSKKPLRLVPCQAQTRHLFEFRADAVQQLLARHLVAPVWHGPYVSEGVHHQSFHDEPINGCSRSTKASMKGVHLTNDD